MKKLMLIVVLALFVQQAQASILDVIDLKPTHIELYDDYLTDDVSNNRVQMIKLWVKNIGNKSLKLDSDFMNVRFGAFQFPYAGIWGFDRPGYNGIIYSPDGIIHPGKEGFAWLELPLGTIRHCQKFNVWIDYDKKVQLGSSLVYLNDKASLVVKEYKNTAPCLDLQPIEF